MKKIYRNGSKVFEKNGIQKTSFEFCWKDEAAREGEAHYIIHIEAGRGHLVTSPIHFRWKGSK